ncbi:aldo/keto reductase [Tomitella biformata]|uniref:aldo/keto reductase n=1 Tax=Tomitella biformata TaxID=630403 RepID=UPI0004B47CE6|nr:aldo/keto reductase [Tomitella biformata]
MTKLGTSELDVFPLALGTNTFGWTSDEATSHAVLDAFAEHEGNFLDSSDSYSSWIPGNSGGESEAIIGSWLGKRGNRDRMMVSTKVAQHPEFQGLAPANIAAACDASLSRLDVDHIDLYYAHQYDPNTSVADAAAAFDTLVKAGKIRHIGLSNFPAERIDEWMAVADREGLARPVALQPHYNLVARGGYEQTLAETARRHDLGVLPYFALASGFLTGKYRTKEDFEGKMRGQMASPYFSAFGVQVLETLDAIGWAHKAEIGTVALAWLRTRENVAAPIASVRTVEQLPALLASATLELTAEEIAALDEVSAA